LDTFLLGSHNFTVTALGSSCVKCPLKGKSDCRRLESTLNFLYDSETAISYKPLPAHPKVSALQTVIFTSYYCRSIPADGNVVKKLKT
jgi:hypothetical protein